MSRASVRPANYSFYDIFQGTTFGPYTLQPKDAAGGVVNLTGWNVFVDARDNPGGPVVFSLGPEIVLGVGIRLYRTDEITVAWPAWRYYWDLILETPQGERKGPYVVGRLNVKMRSA